VDAYAKYNAISNTLRNAACDLELVTTLTLADGSTQEIVHTRRAVCRKATRRRNVTVLEFADIDRASLDKTFPFETFTVSDFPGLYVDHVGRRVTQGVGTVVKVPLTWIVKTGGVWDFAGPKRLGATPATLLAVYRGTQAGQGSLVDSSEYTTGSVAPASGAFTVETVRFTREQSDTQGRPYVLEADYLLPGTRTAPAEAQRLLEAYGIACDGSFAAASVADAAAGFFVDALYNGRTGKAILEDLLRVARGYLVPGAAGLWAITQDVARASVAQFDSKADQISIESYGDGEIRRTISLAYRPRSSAGEDFTSTLTRTTNGPTGEFAMRNPYVRDHVVADRLMSYWQKRLNTLRQAKASLYATQMGNADRITVTDYTVWTGAKDFIPTGITRPGDRNDVVLREYNADVYVYAPGSLPADATNAYAPDYSFTPPLAPSNLAVVSQGVTSDTDGKTTAFALVRAVPPAVNWARLTVQLSDTSTKEVYQAQLLLNAGTGNYEATISGLRPNRTHSILCWATNANNMDGATATLPNITSANAATALAAPTVTVTQLQSFEVKIDLAAVANVAGQPGFYRNVLFESVGGGAYTEVKRDAGRTFIRAVSHGVVYAYKARSEDMNHNESADSSSASITPQKIVDGGYIVDGSINRGRSYTGTASSSVTLVLLTTTDFVMDLYTFFPSIKAFGGQDARVYAVNSGSGDTGRFRLYNPDTITNTSAVIEWRNFLA
jgi:hypothetical protein